MKAKRLLLGALLSTFLVTPGIALGQGAKPNILVIFGDDIGQTNVSAYSMGVMGYRTPNIDRIAKEGMIFTDYYAEQSCTAGRSSFITGPRRSRFRSHWARVWTSARTSARRWISLTSCPSSS